MSRPSQCPACWCFEVCTYPEHPACAERTESRDSKPHVHKVIEAHLPNRETTNANHTDQCTNNE